MNNYHMTSVPFYQKKNSLLKVPKIIIIEFFVNFDSLNELLDNIWISKSKENIMLFIFSCLTFEFSIDKLDNNVYYKHLEFPSNTNYISNEEVNDILVEYKKIILELYNVLKSLGLYNNKSLEYQYGTMLDDNTLVLHIPDENDIN